VEKVTYYSNSSVLNDEVISHRLGLVPLKTDLKTYTMPSECTCKGEGCGKCTLVLTLEAEGPKTVYSGELNSTDPKVVPVYDKIPIIKLAGNQKIKLEAKANLGIGRDHIKWQAGLASYELKEKDTYDFMVESYGQYEPEELLANAFRVMEDRLKELKSQAG